MESHINNRFVEVVNYLLDNKVESKKSSIAEKLNIKPSNFSEILKFRINISLETASLFCDIYNISAEWFLFGKGNMLISNSENLKNLKEPFKQDLNSNEVKLLNELLESYKSKIKDKEEVIFWQSQFIESIRNELINLNSFKHLETFEDFKQRQELQKVQKES